MLKFLTIKIIKIANQLMHIRFFTFFLLVLFQNNVAAESKTLLLTPEEQSHPQISPLNPLEDVTPSMTRTAWLAKIQPAFTTSLCKPKSLIRNCYLIDDKQCQDFSVTISDACFATLKKRLPESLTSVEQKNYYSIVKACTYDLFDKLLVEKQVPHPECRGMGERVLPKEPDSVVEPSVPALSIKPQGQKPATQDKAGKRP